MLANEGASVIIDGGTRQGVQAAIRNLGTRVEPQGLAADLGTAAGVEEAIARFPEVEILVNSIGIYEAKPFDEIPDQDWLRFFEVNVLSGVRLSRHYLPLMKTAQLGTHCLHFE